MIRCQTRQPLLSSHICASTRPSTCDHRHEMLRCMAKGWHAWHRYQRRAARAKRATSRSLVITSRRLCSISRKSSEIRSGQCLSTGATRLTELFTHQRAHAYDGTRLPTYSLDRLYSLDTVWLGLRSTILDPLPRVPRPTTPAYRADQEAAPSLLPLVVAAPPVPCHRGRSG